MARRVRVSGEEWKSNGSPTPITQIVKHERNLPGKETHCLTSLPSSFFFCISPCSEKKHKFIFGMKLSRLQYELHTDILVSKLSNRNKQIWIWSFSERRHSSAERSYSSCPIYLGLHRSSPLTLRSSQSSVLGSVCPARPHPYFLTLPYFLFPPSLWSLPLVTSPEHHCLDDSLEATVLLWSHLDPWLLFTDVTHHWSYTHFYG